MNRRVTGELTGLVVVVTGATGSAGRAAVDALSRSGADVVAVGRDIGRLTALFGGHGEVSLEAADVADRAECADLVERVRDRYGRVDGLVHLVGGWRGGRGFSANGDDDWDFLRSNLIDSLRHITLALHDDLARSDAGRAIIISATAVDSPSAGSANYAAAKAAAESWMRSLAASFATQAQTAGPGHPVRCSAAVILVIKALVDQAMRDTAPQKKFDGFTDVALLADRIVAVFTDDPRLVNGTRIPVG